MSLRARPIGGIEYQQVSCPHCGRERTVQNPGMMLCSGCGGWFEVVEEDDPE